MAFETVLALALSVLALLYLLHALLHAEDL